MIYYLNYSLRILHSRILQILMSGIEFVHFVHIEDLITMELWVETYRTYHQIIPSVPVVYPPTASLSCLLPNLASGIGFGGAVILNGI